MNKRALAIIAAANLASSWALAGHLGERKNLAYNGTPSVTERKVNNRRDEALMDEDVQAPKASGVASVTEGSSLVEPPRLVPRVMTVWVPEDSAVANSER